jgi:hypothetical protein
MLAQPDLSLCPKIAEAILAAAHQLLTSGPSSGCDRLIPSPTGLLVNFGALPGPGACPRAQNQVKLMQHYFVETAQDLHLTFFGQNDEPQFVIDLADNELTYAVVQALAQQGFFVQLVVYPPELAGQAYLGVGLHDNLTFQDIEDLLYTIRQWSDYTYRTKHLRSAYA